MKRRWLFLVGTFAFGLSLIYLFTAVVRPEGSLGDTWLMLKPGPSMENFVGGGEDGAWARAHPGHPSPWWQAQDATKLLYGGSWEEDPVLWPMWYGLGYLLTPILWFVLAIGGLRRALRRAASERGS